MNTVTFPRLLKQSALIITLISSSWLLTACGGNGGSSTSSASSAASSHIFSSTSVTPPGSGTWPDVKISASGTKALKFEWSAAPSGTSFYKLFKKADSTSNFQQVGSNFTATTISDAVSVHLTDWVNSRYKVQACGDSGCVDSTIIVIDNAMLSAITYIKASNAEANDWFGWSIAISGDGKTLAVGAPAEDSNAIGINGDQTSNTSPHSGAVYVFTKTDGNWQQQAYLKASNTEQPNIVPNQTQQTNDRFGFQIAISSDGNTLAVSAIMEDSPSIGINCFQDDIEYTATALNSSSSSMSIQAHVPLDRGAIYIFKRTDNIWAQQAYIKSYSNLSALNINQFGSVLALSGDGKHLAVGVPQDSRALSGVSVLAKNSSSSECFNYNTSQNSSSSNMSNSSTNSSNNSSSISSSSSTSTVPLPGGTLSGAVHVFKLENQGWVNDTYIKAPDATAGSIFGTSLAFSFDGSTLAVGAKSENLDSNSNEAFFEKNGTKYALISGAAYVLTNTNSVWTFQQKLKASRTLKDLGFGVSIAISGDGNTIAVGANGDANPNGGIEPVADDASLNNLLADVGTRIFSQDEKNKFKSNSGAVFIFNKTESTWKQQAYIKAQHPHVNDQLGSSLALSFDGRTLACNVLNESSLARGINGDDIDTSSANSGAVYIFTLLGNSWTQKSYVKAPNSNANDRFGFSIGLDASGETFVAGAHRESSNAKNINNGDKEDNSAVGSGAVYIY